MKCIYCEKETNCSFDVCIPCDVKKFKEFTEDPEVQKMLREEFRRVTPHKFPKAE